MCSKHSGSASSRRQSRIALSIDDLGFGFMFARSHHPAMRFVAPVGAEIGIRTVFNVLGPARESRRCAATASSASTPRSSRAIYAEALAELGARKAFVVARPRWASTSSRPLGTDFVVEVADGDVREWELDPTGPRDRARRPWRPCRAARQKRMPPSSGAVLAGEPGGRRDAVLAERGRWGSSPPGSPTTSSRRSRSAPRRSTRAPRAAASKRSFPSTRRRGPDGELRRRPLLFPGLGAIAEIKRRSPSAGDLRPDADPAVIAPAYAEAGAAAISVLVDERFGGAWDDLRAARAATTAPLLAKGFFSTEEHLRPAKGAGADAVLLLLRDLDDGDGARLLGVAEEPRARHARGSARRRGARARDRARRARARCQRARSRRRSRSTGRRSSSSGPEDPSGAGS